jgi:hypothetical protein
MSTDSPDIITQAELRVGAGLMENASIAAHICEAYMQQLKSRLALGGAVERGPLTFQPETMYVSHYVC